jgi:hypothetical protein
MVPYAGSSIASEPGQPCCGSSSTCHDRGMYMARSALIKKWPASCSAVGQLGLGFRVQVPSAATPIGRPLTSVLG